MKVLAPAKINLALHILGKRDDGYHDLSSLVCFSQFGDQIEIIENTQDIIAFEGEFALNVSDENNSVIKALKWFRNRENISQSYAIYIEKNIPVEAGLGGGTADCAAVLQTLYKMQKLTPPSFADLKALGADVPVSFYGDAAIMEGIGEKITPTKLDQDYGLILINPRLQTPTGQIFSMLKSYSKPIEHHQVFGLPEIERLENSMTKAAITLHPEIGELIQSVKALDPLLVRMSGSGATVFAMVPIGEENKFAKNIEKQFPNYWIKATQIKRSTT